MLISINLYVSRSVLNWASPTHSKPGSLAYTASFILSVGGEIFVVAIFLILSAKKIKYCVGTFIFLLDCQTCSLVACIL